MSDSQHRHPTPEQLVSYREGKLGAAQEQGVRSHLVTCQECGDLLLDLAALETSEQPTPEVSELETRKAWKKQRQRLRLERWWEPWAVGWWVAAAMCLLSAGLWSRMQILDHRLRAVYSEDVSRVLVDGNSERGSRQEAPELVLRGNRPGLVLLLLPPHGLSPPFEATFYDEEGTQLVLRTNLTDAEDLLVIPVDRGQLPEGKIRVEVHGESSGGKQRVEDFDFVVQHRE